MPDGAALLLSVAKFYTPGGKAIQDNAITPNVVVSNEDDLAALEDDTTPETTPESKPPVPKQDRQLQRAVELLKTRKA